MPKMPTGSKTAVTVEPTEPKTTGKGWGAVASKQMETAANQDAAKNQVYEFKIKDGETATVQFLTPEPLCMDVHNVVSYVKGKKRFEKTPCQLATQDHCLLCQDGVKTSWVGAFLVLDYRGDWDKAKNDYKYDKPVIRKWLTSQTVASQLDARRKKSGKQLTDFVLDVTRSGSGPRDTSYSFDRAEADSSTESAPKFLRPIEVTKLPDIAEIMRPLSDKILVMRGYQSSEDDVPTPKGVKRRPPVEDEEDIPF